MVKDNGIELFPAMADAFYASSNKASSERFKLGLRKAGLPN
jgi:hypothetical protein